MKSESTNENSGRVVLIVDDEAIARQTVEMILDPLGYEIVTASCGREALMFFKQKHPDMILLDIGMPDMSGFETARKIRRLPGSEHIPIVMLTGLQDVSDRVEALKAGADDFLVKPVDAIELQTRVKTSLKIKQANDRLLNYQAELEAEVRRKTTDLSRALKKLKASSHDTVVRLSRAAEYRDEYTSSHIHRMSRCCELIAKKLDMDAEMMLHASPLHDIGKIGIPDHILLKPGQLDEKEWDLMKQHTLIGAEILDGAEAEAARMGGVIALTHHEKWDGTGYPSGLKGRQIPLPGRVAAVADVFDALTMKRPYKEPFSLEKSFRIISEGRGTHFDPEVVDVFFENKEEIIGIRERFNNGGLERRLQVTCNK